ncbi:DUF6175 family protein [uncultured Prevotella sp.]|uniref:DUF6175 family protein n=1 Tax=uncultured Prevotella sp. TaxID=159272 RepID=UPI0026028DFD|nr:DUF6175 family protein [uncultured Prevotella sp.]
MKKIIFFLLALVATVAKAQNVSTVQPKIMVMPYVAEGVDIRQTIETDPNIRIVLSKIREAFDKRGFTTIDFETKLKAQSANNALSDNAQTNRRSMIIQSSGADIYVETEYIYTPSQAGNSVKVLMKACDVSTGGALASKDAFSGQFYTEDVGRLAGAAVEKVADEFLNVIQTKFDDIVENGRSISLDIKIDESSTHSLHEEMGESELVDQIEDWVADHAYKNNYHIQGSTEVEMIFDEIRIPLKDENGRNYNINQFDREVRQLFRKLGIKVSHVSKNNTLVITIK